ncbi:hypothetical protein AQPE_2172 [Aquipluma nitroreducens]|uniref:Uncharacterized protein n=1 Tax=Aquipluma nitroreducens TaxID=2010828 RepID=A0A5K7S8X7_9BACT|nr:hypothetical protein [Aquipluma nitroreducens]BBE18013.1 hypothetical protein AQPE_2172 [Aquipluma nitroreducens]
MELIVSNLSSCFCSSVPVSDILNQKIKNQDEKVTISEVERSLSKAKNYTSGSIVLDSTNISSQFEITKVDGTDGTGAHRIEGSTTGTGEGTGSTTGTGGGTGGGGGTGLGTGYPGLITYSLNNGTPNFAIGLNSTLEEYKLNSRDITKDVSNFTFLGISLALLIFSIYFFSSTSRLYRSKIENWKQEAIIDQLIYMIALIFVSSWVALICYVKNLKLDFIFQDLVLYPKQYILGIILAILILSITSIYRHFLLLRLFSIEESSSENQKKKNVTLVTLTFSAVNLGSSLITIITAFF